MGYAAAVMCELLPHTTVLRFSATKKFRPFVSVSVSVTAAECASSPDKVVFCLLHIADNRVSAKSVHRGQSVRQFGNVSPLISDITALVSYHGNPFSTLGYEIKSIEGE